MNEAASPWNLQFAIIPPPQCLTNFKRQVCVRSRIAIKRDDLQARQGVSDVAV
jgi:hypothetical protein